MGNKREEELSEEIVLMYMADAYSGDKRGKLLY